MDIIDLMELIELGEDSKLQFKSNFSSIASLAAEITAFLNSDGGQILIGISDEGDIEGLSWEDVNRLNQWVSSTCTNKIEPAPMNVKTENVKVEGEKDSIVMVVRVPPGSNKFYMANGTDAWVKVGADKRKANREELRRLLQESANLYADEMPVPGTGLEDMDLSLFKDFYKRRTEEDFEQSEIEFEDLLRSLKLYFHGKLTLAGLLVFGKEPYVKRPEFIIKAISFVGNTPDGFEYRDSRDIKGNIIKLYQEGKSFLTSNLRHQQKGQGFNTTGILEIPVIALEEALTNALLHRNYFLASNIRLFIFDNRVEIISPGTLPNTVEVENIKYGMHVERNPLLMSIVRDLKEIPYRGVGTGVRNILKACKEEGTEVEFIDDDKTQEFKVVFFRSE